MHFASDEAVYALYNSKGHINALDTKIYPDKYAETIENDVKWRNDREQK